MAKYLFIESRDPFEATGPARTAELAASFAKEGDEVAVYLTQNGVLAARGAAKASRAWSGLASAAKAKILVDDYSLAERGIEKAELASGMHVSSVDALVDLLLVDGQRILWC